MVQIFDYSSGYPRPFEIKNSGRKGVIRYLRKEGISSVKVITKDELRALLNEGLDVGFIYEHVDKSRARDGYLAGQHDADWAINRAYDLGLSEQDLFGIYFTVDYDAPVGDYGKIFDYYSGIYEHIGYDRSGAYAKWDLLKRLFDLQIIKYGWQTYAWSPGHNKDPKTFEQRAHLFQNLGTFYCDRIPCDTNEVLKSDWGQYRKYVPPTPEVDMQLTDVVGLNPDGTPYTVQDVLEQIKKTPDTVVKMCNNLTQALNDIKSKIDKLPEETRNIATKRYNDLASILYTFDNQPQWGSIAQNNWDTFGEKKWAQL